MWLEMLNWKYDMMTLKAELEMNDDSECQTKNVMMALNTETEKWWWLLMLKLRNNGGSKR